MFFWVFPHFIFYIQPLKMEPIEGSETSADLKLTPGKYPKEHIQYSKPDGSLKSRININVHNPILILLNIMSYNCIGKKE